MNTETQEETMGTLPVTEHEWLRKLVGEWRTESEMDMPDGSKVSAQGHESVESLGGLWAFSKGSSEMPGGKMDYYAGIGWDVSFKEYRGFKIMSVSSHLWKCVGTLSENGRKMTLDCEGPDMEVDGKTAMYRDVIEIVDDNHRTLASGGLDAQGNWQVWMTARYTRE